MKKRKGMQIGKVEIKLSLFATDMIFYIANPDERSQRRSK